MPNRRKTVRIMKNKLALFDLDGTLIDTLKINYESYRIAMEEVGRDFDIKYYEEYCFGKNYRDFLPQILEEDEALVKRVHDRKLELYLQCFDMGHPNEALKDFIIHCGDIYHMVVATTATRSNVEAILKHFGIYEYIERIYAQEDVTKFKPDPQIFEMAMRDFGIEPEDTVIFEDSKVGLEAAYATGAAVIKIEKF